jgi:hypothetical protein
VEGVKCCGLSWNPYIYVKDNPINAVDPRGLADTIEEGRLDAEVEQAAKNVESLWKYQKRSRNPFYCMESKGPEDQFDYIASRITCLADLEE